MMNKRALAGAAMLVLCAGWAQAQSTADSVTVRSSTAYQRSAFWRALFGTTWRPVWNAEIKVPVLDLATFAGGLEPFKQGGNQSKTLRLRGANGRVYSFRSVDKDVQRAALPPDLRHTPVGAVIQDQTAAFHPSGALPTSRLEDAVGLFNAPPSLYFLPDDAKLGKYRDTFKNMLGQLEERREDGPKDELIGGAKDIIGTEDLFFKLDHSLKNRIDARQYLTARFIDFIIGDTDRGQDQWRWARFDVGDTNLYRPIPRDRDYAFMRTEGLLTGTGMRIYAKMTKFGPEFPRLHSLTFMTGEFDRSHLVELPWATWDSVVNSIQHALTDQVIDETIQRFPPSHRMLSGAYVRAGLRGRRDALREQALGFYHMVAEDADVFGSDDDETAEIERNSDGSVTVRIFRTKEKAGSDNPRMLVYDRTFKSGETQDIRVYLERGNDSTIVRGNVERSIALRVIGGEGDDVFIDSSRVAQHAFTAFYDATGQNVFAKGPETRVDERPYYWAPPNRYFDVEENAEKPDKDPRKINEERRGRYLDLTAGYLDKRTGSDNPRSWGRQTVFGGLIYYHDGPGVILGFGPTFTDFGFRRAPFETQHAVRVLAAFRGDFGVQLNSEKHFENSRWALTQFTHATQLESNRFFGYGNQSPFVDPPLTIVRRDEILVLPAVVYALNKKSMLSIGPMLRLARPHPEAGGPPLIAGAEGTRSYQQAGVRADLALIHANRTAKQQKGVDVLLGGSASSWNRSAPFQETHGVAKLFVPAGPATLAFRAGGKRVWGRFPLQEAAYIGGDESLRGFWWNRYAGNASAYGAAEVRLPLFRTTLLTRTNVGVIGFTDAGRIWLNNKSPGGWHTGAGGGFFLATSGQAISLTYAKGEAGRMYLALGMPF